MCKELTSLSLLSEIEGADLYKKLIGQLNKDFNLAGIEQFFSSDCTPSELIQQLQKIVVKLITTNFDGYLNLLYRVDLSENKIKKLEGANLDKMSEQVAYLLLKREWQKVWFKSRF
ncbi:MAG: hypothetical protein COB73_06370 [Flavobacteriaceae bacterium]|nr:MAG: hypothetical protein COB73_06370 [Flavobacteriaceae bacterium]